MFGMSKNEKRIKNLELKVIELCNAQPVMSYVSDTYIGYGGIELPVYKDVEMGRLIRLLLDNAGLEITETPSTESKIILKPKETPKAAKPKKA